MNHYPEPVIELIKNLSKLPGIGRKTAERLTFHLLNTPGEETDALAGSIVELKKKVTLCSVCFALSEKPVCRICADPSRDPSCICVVENPGDMTAIEKSGAFSGVYHVLGGTLSPIDGIGPDELRIRELFARVASGGIKEIILATGTGVEGESTASYIRQKLKEADVRVTRIASGVPIGGDLKYVDRMTMQKAMERRHGF